MSQNYDSQIMLIQGYGDLSMNVTALILNSCTCLRVMMICNHVVTGLWWYVHVLNRAIVSCSCIAMVIR